MKKFGKVVVGAVVGGLVFTSSAKAVENVSQLYSTQTQKKYQRKAVMGLDIGLPSRTLPVIIKYCANRCRIEGTWNYYISPQIEKGVEKEIYDWLITQRFDKVIISPDEAIIITAGSKEKLPISYGKFFSFDVGSYNEFKKAVEDYLQQLSDTVSKLLSSAMEARYEELPEKEKETFITTKAKELGIPVEIAKKLMSSAYVFALYMEPEPGKLGVLNTSTGATLKITPKRKLLGGIEYKASFDIPAKAKLLIYKFDPDQKKFVFYKELKGESGAGVGESATYPVYPTQAMTEGLFAKTMVLTAKAVGINLNAQLKKDDNFAIFSTVDKVSGNKIYSKIGVIEDLRIDAPYIVKEFRNGKWENVGWAKARHVAINCYQYITCPPGNNTCTQEKQSDKNIFSRFDLIKGKVAFKDQLREHPWTGLFLYGGIGIDRCTLNKLEDALTTYNFSKGGGTFVVGKIGAALDLGYVFNSKFLSEVWLNVFLGIGGGGDAMESSSAFYWLTSDNSTESPIYYTAGIGLYKRFYIGATGFYFMLGGDLLYQGMSATLKQNTSYNLVVNSYSFGINAVGGYNLSPDFEVALKLGYNFPISTSASIKENWYGSSVYSYDTADVSGGLTALFTLRWHLFTVGPFARFYKKPSAICEKIKERYKIK